MSGEAPAGLTQESIAITSRFAGFLPLRSSAFPTAAQGQEQVDLAHGNLGVGRRQLRTHIGVGARGLQVGQEGFAAGLEEAVGLARRFSGRLFGVGQGVAMLIERQA